MNTQTKRLIMILFIFLMLLLPVTTGCSGRDILQIVFLRRYKAAQNGNDMTPCKNTIRIKKAVTRAADNASVGNCVDV